MSIDELNDVRASAEDRNVDLFYVQTELPAANFVAGDVEKRTTRDAITSISSYTLVCDDAQDPIAQPHERYQIAIRRLQRIYLRLPARSSSLPPPRTRPSRPLHLVVVAPIHLVSSSDNKSLGRWRGQWGMNSTAAPYTPLECLLLFQTLVVYGTGDQDFERISSLLTNNPLVRDAETYDAQRLSADALRQLYLGLLRDELRAEEEGPEDQMSRKRKLPSPPLPSIKDAQEYKDKLPLLVNRLYARYREYMIRAIQEDERQYARVQQEIKEIERGEWDEKLLREGRAANGIPTAEARRYGVPEALILHPKAHEVPREGLQNPPHPSPRPEGIAISDVLNGTSTKPSSPRVPEHSRLPGYPPPPARPGSIGPHGPSPLQTPLQAGVDGHHPGPPPFPPPQPAQHYAGPPNGQPGQYTWEPPFAPPPMQPGHGYQFNGQHPQQYPPYPPQHHAHQQPFSSPHGLPPPPLHVPSSPINPNPHQIVLPPPNGIARQPPGSPAMPLDALADAAGQQYRANSGSPMIQHGRNPGSPMPPQGPPQSPMTQGFHVPPSGHHGPPHASPMGQHGSLHPQSPALQGSPHFPYTPQQRPSSGNGPPQWNQQQPIQFSSPSQHNSIPPNQRLPFQPTPNTVPKQPKAYHSPYNPNKDKKPPALRSSFPQTPLGGPVRLRTGTGTLWTPTATIGTPVRPELSSFNSPAIEPNSPVQRPAILPEKKTPKKAEAPTMAQSVEKPRKEPKAKTARRAVGRPRAGSVASSVMAGSPRSQSVMSHGDELSLDNETLHRAVKQEVATPVGIEDIADTTADEQPPPPSRSGPSPRQALKRKRASSISLPPIEVRPSVPPTHVLWTRAFPNISKSALESIAGHRNASTFAAPVKVKDAPGYKEIILRPQDLTSIRKAISAGHRAATAAAPDDLPANASSAWLEITEDLIPPKGIINYAQLEKELMRMFANAIMFNLDPGRGLARHFQSIGKGRGDVIGYEIDEDGVVKDTKAMFFDVEKTVGALRSAERRSEEMRENSMLRAQAVDENMQDDDADEPAGEGETTTGVGNTGTIKRRRKA
ncbi:WD domain containing protein [Drepanopeziza brunnea f. sp. 'multigermtubi' MB_m1]|uniref:WD domain containing protein n=1 Tax=Marssonina brunnea f. sp. multigermtubi (strain MB_m1) TaxID=1072389 RepID=K1WKG0_MARBU|nr:WD domain containing protein [Drepanopeziza brunnea f. sp. 'multigermtubi' MB_m1]EKD12712.1 WD domain containing protein [Drepanopeziza brunnea f. sp. 'multigermtubi' MB_m1]